jgi:two-component system NtrC family sensor kinase
MWKRALFRPLEALAMVLLVACVLSIIGLGQLAARGRSRLQLIHTRVAHTNHILQVGLQAQQSLLAHRESTSEVNETVAEDLRHEVEGLLSSGVVLDPENASRLQRLREVLHSEPRLSRERLVQVVAVLNRVLESETSAQAELWRRIGDDSNAELDLVLGIALSLVLLALAAAWLGRRWFVKPLVDLRLLLTQLASGEREQVTSQGIHPVLTPLFDNYNQLVTRLEELENEHLTHARILEGQIRDATATLLEQQATLARAERLAAVGETTACLAHELRNPLAGILMSLGNLRSEADDPALIERFDVVIAEIERLTRLLNDSLSAARHAPEALRDVQLCQVVDDLLALLRFQIPSTIELRNLVPPDLSCALPADRIRQALLNLVLNSVTALAQRPGSVTVAAAHTSDRLTLVVEDDGPGFPPEILHAGARAFATRSTRGTGLGLAMVRRVALDLGGELHLEQPESGGARVRLELPWCHG